VTVTLFELTVEIVNKCVLCSVRHYFWARVGLNKRESIAVRFFPKSGVLALSQF
jgi:hypothetical protein